MSGFTFIEPFAGAAAVSLRLVGGPHLTPLVSWMGGKRRLAAAIMGAMGISGRPSRVVLNDAGPWGWVWAAVLDHHWSVEIATILRRWADTHPRELWEELAEKAPSECDGLAERVAQWLWLQARSASGVPVWWSGWRLEASDGRGVPRPAGQRGHRWEQQSGPKKGGRGTAKASMCGAGSWRQCDHANGRSMAICQTGGLEWRMGEERTKSTSGERSISQGGTSRSRAGGITTPATIADRIDAVCEAFARVEWRVHHGGAEDLEVRVDGPTFVYLDPPYVGATGYGWDCERAQLVEMAQHWHDAGAVVAISEAEPVDVAGWHHLEVTRPGGKPEWLTLSRPPERVPQKQRRLFVDVQS